MPILAVLEFENSSGKHIRISCYRAQNGPSTVCHSFSDLALNANKSRLTPATALKDYIVLRNKGRSFSPLKEK